MPSVREQLLASTFWSVRRPKVPLTQGHFVIRLNDPSIALSVESAADLLRCYGHLRLAMAEMVGASAAQLYMAMNWQPVGDAVGEPIAETSTPTLHTFVSFPGSTTAASALCLSAHDRAPVTDTADLDGKLRSWHGGKVTPGPRDEPAPGSDAEGGSDSEGGQERSFHIAPAGPQPGNPYPSAQWTAVPRFPASTLDRMAPALLLELTHTMEGLASQARPPFQGTTLWITDPWDFGTPATINIFARRHGYAPLQLVNFIADGGLDLPAT